MPRDDGVPLHAGLARYRHRLIQSIDVWENYLSLWAGIATPGLFTRFRAVPGAKNH